SSRGGISTLEGECRKLIPSGTAHPRISAYLMASTTITMAASVVAQRFGVKGHCTGLSNACASGTTAIGEAFRLVRHGYSPIALAGGAEAPLCRIAVEGYGAAGALSLGSSPAASSPFDISRDGFVLAEGGCVLVLEEYGSALSRGARIYGEIAGYGNTTDAFHMTRPDASGEVRAILSALDDAGISHEEVDFISAHGTSTPLGDRTEAEAIGRVWKKRASSIPVYALKGMTGHMLGASGAVETACAFMVIGDGIVPPTINLRERDPDCDLSVVPSARAGEFRVGLVQSFGFGGVNSVLVLKAHGMMNSYV
ncbi:MAG: beta-ketoacyl-[acyl-carrier-protein] synthase family protein, partial [Nitrospirales bacterium]|nr:beta-ketoacyl-[acyl-carrier-protein] synthase family protein [Nitrospirales bacterium]